MAINKELAAVGIPTLEPALVGAKMPPTAERVQLFNFSVTITKFFLGCCISFHNSHY